MIGSDASVGSFEFLFQYFKAGEQRPPIRLRLGACSRSSGMRYIPADGLRKLLIVVLFLSFVRVRPLEIVRIKEDSNHETSACLSF